MNLLVIGGGGREHALTWKIVQSARCDKVYCAPGNPGTAGLEKAENVALNPNDHDAVAEFCRTNAVDLVVVGPEDPLCAGIADALNEAGIKVFGPSAAAARIEGSKGFAKDFMRRFDIPTADYACFESAESAKDYVREQGAPVVVKADGLAAGKGVTVARDVETACQAIDDAMVGGVFGESGRSVVIEECMVGEEASILAFCDGTTFRTLATSQDHKPAYDNDEGPNTGGMGAYSPAPVVTPELQARIDAEVLAPFVEGMRSMGTPYVGIIYAGLMMTETGPRVVEFNCRFGDPEAQAVLPRLKSDVIDVMLACIDGRLGEMELQFDDGACVAVVMASGGYPGSYEKGMPISGIDAAESDSDVVVFHAGTKAADGAIVTSGGRVLAVTASGSDLPGTIAKAYEAAGKVSFEGAHLRSDIGKKALGHLGR